MAPVLCRGRVLGRLDCEARGCAFLDDDDGFDELRTLAGLYSSCARKR
jgi:hypothetical protein